MRVIILVQDRNTNDLHNTGEVMIMQMRKQRESQKTSREGGFYWNCVRPGNNQNVRQRLGECSDSDHNKHRDNTQTRQNTGKLPERCKTKPKQISEINRQNRQLSDMFQLQDHNMLLFEPLLCCLGRMFWVIVMLEDPSTTHFQCSYCGKEVVAPKFPGTWPHSSWWKKKAPVHVPSSAEEPCARSRILILHGVVCYWWFSFVTVVPTAFRSLTSFSCVVLGWSLTFLIIIEIPWGEILRGAPD